MNGFSINDLNFLSVDDFANILKMSKTAVYRIISTRKIPFYKIGHNIRFAENDVFKYLEDSRIEPITYKR